MYDLVTFSFGLYILKIQKVCSRTGAQLRFARVRAVCKMNVLATHLWCVYPPCPSSVRRMKLNSSSSSTAAPFFPLG